MLRISKQVVPIQYYLNDNEPLRSIVVEIFYPKIFYLVSFLPALTQQQPLKMILKLSIILIFSILLSESLGALKLPKFNQKSFSLKFSDIQKGIKNFQKVIKTSQKVIKTSQKVIKTSQKVASIITKVSATSSTRQGEGVYESYAVCSVCQSVIDEFMFMRRVEFINETDLIAVSIELCELFEIQTERVCRGVIELNAPTILYIVDQRQDLTADTVCRFLLDDGDCLNPYNDDNLDFAVTIDENVNENSENENENIVTTTSSPQQQQLLDDDLVIVHITDIHVDFKYKKGALAACKDFACCRDMEISDDVNATLLAGYWGDYRGCDTPWHALEDAFNQIVRQHSVGFFF